MKELLDSIAIRKFSIESVLTEMEALEIIRSAMIPPEWLDFFAPKIMELANQGEIIEVIKIECSSLMSQISVAGGLENYKRLKGL
ncbi:hypothetical protein [Runella limosa]|uniref:hypothetical protein n=1 Tax=Runella limosa TaxID=370978 RepID=UPI000428BD7E|nr:hypothetical protein [Runella limosa]